MALLEIECQINESFQTDHD